MQVKFLLLFLTVAFAEDIVDANRIDRTYDDLDDMGPVFPFDAFGLGYEDFISQIHPPLMAAMNYRPVMPHDVSHLVSDGRITSVALSSSRDVVDEPNEETESFTSATLEVLPSPESFSSTTPEMKYSSGESSTKTVEAAAGTEESTEDIYVEPEDDSEKNSDAETTEYQTDKASTLSDDSLFTSDKEIQSLNVEDRISSKEKSSTSNDKSKDSAEEAAGATRDEASSAVYEPKDSELNESESSKMHKSLETEELTSKGSELSKSEEKSITYSDDDYYYSATDYMYTESEVFESGKAVSDEELITPSYEYSDSTSEYYSTELVQSEEKVFVFLESHQMQETSQSNAEKAEYAKTSQPDISREQESASANLKSDSFTDGNVELKASNNEDSKRDFTDGTESSSKSSKTSDTFEGNKDEKGNKDEINSSNDENPGHDLDEDSKTELDSDSEPASVIGSESALSESSKPTQVFSKPASSDSESHITSSSSSTREKSESSSGKTSFSVSSEAAASTSFLTSSKSSERSGEFVNIPQIMEAGVLLKEAPKVYGQRLDFEKMRKIIEHGYTELSSLRKKLTRKEYVLGDLNQVIDELQTLCQAICATVPEKYLMTDSDSKSSSSKSKLH